MGNLKNDEKIIKPAQKSNIFALISAGVIPAIFLTSLALTINSHKKIDNIKAEMTNNSEYQELLNYEVDKQQKLLENDKISYSEYLDNIAKINNDLNYNGILEKASSAKYKEYKEHKTDSAVSTALTAISGASVIPAIYHLLKEEKDSKNEGKEI